MHNLRLLANNSKFLENKKLSKIKAIKTIDKITRQSTEAPFAKAEVLSRETSQNLLIKFDSCDTSPRRNEFGESLATFDKEVPFSKSQSKIKPNIEENRRESRSFNQ